MKDYTTAGVDFIQNNEAHSPVYELIQMNVNRHLRAMIDNLLNAAYLQGMGDAYDTSKDILNSVTNDCEPE